MKHCPVSKKKKRPLGKLLIHVIASIDHDSGQKEPSLLEGLQETPVVTDKWNFITRSLQCVKGLVTEALKCGPILRLQS